MYEKYGKQTHQLLALQQTNKFNYTAMQIKEMTESHRRICKSISQQHEMKYVI